MPRPRRIDAPGYPQHVVQRGNNRQAVFFSSTDPALYLGLLRDCAIEHHCRIHAYVLMGNHVHLLVTPDAPGGLSRMMQAVNRAYVRRVNERQQRTGTLWEGRFHSALVDTDRHLPACQRHIELNPVRAGNGGACRGLSLVELSRECERQGECIDRAALGVRADCH